MQESTASLEDAEILSDLGTNSSYWQIEVDNTDKVKNAFTSTHVLYQFIVTPFGLKKAPDTF